MTTSKKPTNYLIVLLYTHSITGETYDILEEYIKTIPCIGTNIITETGTIPCYIVSGNKYANAFISNLYFANNVPLIRDNFHYAYSDKDYYYFTRIGGYSNKKDKHSYIKIHKENYDRYLLHA